MYLEDPWGENALLFLTRTIELDDVQKRLINLSIFLAWLNVRSIFLRVQECC